MQRNGQKGAVQYLGVWEREVTCLHDQVIVYDQIEVNGPGSILVLAPLPAQIFLNAPQHLVFQLYRPSLRLNFYHAIVVRRLFRSALGLGEIDSGNSHDAYL
jgi:hypothetical protein